MLSRNEFLEVYELLDQTTPIEGDCGMLCGAACCQQDSSEEELGMYLLPGEASVHDKADPWLSWSEDDPSEYDFPESWDGPVDFICCKGPANCKRRLRPIQCRTFPLAPHLSEEGQLYMILNDMELPYECPLITNYQSLNPDFIANAAKAWKILIRDPKIFDLVYMDSRDRDSLGVPYMTACVADEA